MPSEVAVVIPVYKEELNELEKISLAQCRKILGKYPLIFVAPEGKNFSYFAQGNGIVHFPQQFFQSVQTYNRLMMSPGFYATFKDFEYILIYQLDAFVFYDALEYFCSLGYDYIGAPWPRIYREILKDKILPVGNGGFSLRNVQAHHNLLINRSELIAQWHERHLPEDVFFSYCGQRGYNNFKVAPINVAYKFSAEFNPSRVVKKNNGKLPFGCHAWHNHHPDFYSRIFLQFGYDLRPVQHLLTNDDGGLRNWLLNLSYRRFNRRLQREQPIRRYLPQKNFASVRVMRHPFNMFILTRLLSEDNSLADKIFLYDPDETDLLLQDLTLQKQPHLLIAKISESDALTAAVEQKGFAYGKRFVSFWREYFTRCEELFRKLGK